MNNLIIEEVKARGIPKPENDQNTDDILPAKFLREITFRNMGNYIYFDERFEDGNLVKEHPFNNPVYQSGKILIVGDNYGCGSSREHAPQGLKKYGIEAIIGGSFAEIFAGNCTSLGIPTVTVPNEIISKLAEYVQENPSEEIEIDLNEKKIKYDEETISFEMPEGRRQAFLNGTWDALSVLQKNEEAIRKVEEELPYLNFK